MSPNNSKRKYDVWGKMRPKNRMGKMGTKNRMGKMGKKIGWGKMGTKKCQKTLRVPKQSFTMYLTNHDIANFMKDNGREFMDVRQLHCVRDYLSVFDITVDNEMIRKKLGRLQKKYCLSGRNFKRFEKKEETFLKKAFLEKPI